MATGLPPHYGLRPTQILVGKAGEDGLPLEWPADAEPTLRKVGIACLDLDAARRPTFDSVVRALLIAVRRTAAKAQRAARSASTARQAAAPGLLQQETDSTLTASGPFHADAALAHAPAGGGRGADGWWAPVSSSAARIHLQQAQQPQQSVAPYLFPAGAFVLTAPAAWADICSSTISGNLYSGMDNLQPAPADQ
ncbi:hypothetical protein TSOC_001453 [Tetrabaena socialis]|uniref:Uncharacterized protein n=1 Tax=Tetrabaena socialis TaxID=47790 RepID=A0A2J8AGL2_9CHLO|nr:hypothetical protein TSOC_001453 [Tetrabaena socialis]|eukprot:PNH11665.1 hypothetical protein TSOC_001453 [Tetrabaena socialis]